MRAGMLAAREGTGRGFDMTRRLVVRRQEATQNQNC